jgi:hypothetical protein
MREKKYRALPTTPGSVILHLQMLHETLRQTLGKETIITDEAIKKLSYISLQHLDKTLLACSRRTCVLYCPDNADTIPKVWLCYYGTDGSDCSDHADGTTISSVTGEAICPRVSSAMWQLDH